MILISGGLNGDMIYDFPLEPPFSKYPHISSYCDLVFAVSSSNVILTINCNNIKTINLKMNNGFLLRKIICMKA